MMKKGTCFFIIVAWAILGTSTASWGQQGYRFEEDRELRAVGEPGQAVVKVYGPDALTDLAAQAIEEQRPGVAVETYYKPLKDKVLIEGTTGSGTMPLSPKRVGLMQAARARGKSVYAALCEQQKGVIQQTVGRSQVSRREEVRTETRVYYVRPFCPPPPPPFVVCPPPMPVGVAIGAPFPFYGYGGYRRWGVGPRAFHRSWGPSRPFRPFHAGHQVPGRVFRGFR